MSYTPGASAPVILRHPADRTLLAGADAVFSVVAGGTPPLSCQWRKDASDIVGATSAGLSLTNLHRQDSGVVAVWVTNAYGNILSSNAALIVRAPQRLSPLPSSPEVGFGVCFGDTDGGLLRPGDVANFQVRASTNLTDWLTLTNKLELTNGLLILRDPDSTNYPARFYRVIEK